MKMYSKEANNNKIEEVNDSYTLAVRSQPMKTLPWTSNAE